MQQRTFHVSEIHCDGCRSTIHQALGDIDGIEQVNADIDTDDILVVFDEQRIDADRIGELLDEAGFPIQQVRTDDADATPVGSEEGQRDVSPSAVARYGVLVAAVGAIAVAGYVGYLLYPRFDLPAVEGAGLLGLAAAAGIASFFSPCSFPLLVGLLGRQAATQAAGAKSARPLVFGGALALGAATFMLLAGAVIAAGGEALFAGVTFTSTAGIAIRSIVGVLLILFGLIQLGRLPVSFHAVERLAGPISRRQATLRREKPVAGFALFGFGYVLAGFG
jgi:copper chaperone CopZ/cytochrome c biogenesis protein CcdA